MIINTPVHEELNDISLRLLFDSWSAATGIINDFYNHNEYKDTDVNEEDLENELNNYIEYNKILIAEICTKIQHSAELRLKSLICKVSPYLLLKGAPFITTNNSADIDFTEQKTIDATDLPSAVQKLTDFNLSDKYLNKYSEMRKLRNKVAHLGTKETSITPEIIITTIIDQYIALWPDGRWLERRRDHYGTLPIEYFENHKYLTKTSNIMIELEETIDFFSNKQFKDCFGTPKSKLTAYCPYCMSETAREAQGGHPTAYQTSKDNYHCCMCNRNIQAGADLCDECGQPIHEL